MIKHLVFLLILFSAYFSLAQEQEFSIHAVVYDATNGETMPFVSIYKTRDKQGTLSDFNGEFTLNGLQPNDTVVFSYIGYEKTVLIAHQNDVYDTIQLQSKVQLVDEVTVLADKSILYELVANARKTASSSAETAKSYFELETYNNHQQLELFQGYYNGTYKGYNVADLKLKSGRFALAPINKRIFASTESSKVMYMHNLVEPNTYFPSSPFEFSQRKLYKNYTLALNAKYKDADNKTIYIISFEPRESPNEFFSGKVWIDSLSNDILKVSLHVTNAAVYPFKAFWKVHSLDGVNMNITKSFKDHRLQTINFNYDLVYNSVEDGSTTISTQAVLHAYNYDDTFLLPFFDFPATSSADYRQIQMLPVNQEFWDCATEFSIENDDAKNAFINDQATINAYNLFSSDTIFKKKFFESPYVVWNGNRIVIKGIDADSAMYYEKKRVMYADRYNLKVQLFVDVNELCDSIQVITKTVFDPYESFFHFETTKENQAFLNIYFDLMEIERRKMATAIEAVKNNPVRIREVYEKALAQAEHISEIYFKEVQRGTEKKAMEKWNTTVVKELAIDNLALIGVEME